MKKQNIKFSGWLYQEKYQAAPKSPMRAPDWPKIIKKDKEISKMKQPAKYVALSFFFKEMNKLSLNTL